MRLETSSTDQNKQSPAIKCAQPGCKKTYANDDEATKDGAYLAPDGRWFCHQHNPCLVRTN